MSNECKKYEHMMVDKFPDHVKGACYAIKYFGHTMFPEDVIKELNKIEKLKEENETLKNQLDRKRCKECINRDMCYYCKRFYNDQYIKDNI